jgi:hypothetical protein
VLCFVGRIQFLSACHMNYDPYTVFSVEHSTGHFIMFSVITKIYNKKTKGPTLMEFFTATRKLKKFFLTTRGVDVCTTGDRAHNWNIVRCMPCHTWCTHRTSLVVKKNFFRFLVAVKNSIKVGPLVFML